MRESDKGRVKERKERGEGAGKVFKVSLTALV
jgi:hypothetical protein